MDNYPRHVTTKWLLAGAAVGALSIPATARAQEAQGTSVSEEIIVTARVGQESLQDVPVSVQVVTGEAIRKLALTDATEISKLAPGLNLNSPTGNSNNLELILRGVRWTASSGTPAIPTYLNEIAFQPTAVLTSLFDIGQVEVLRGPQGTTRGAPSISGAVTIATMRPDLDDFGGYASGLIGANEHRNAQAAINVPIIAGKLAVRVAGVYDRNEGSGIKGISAGLPDPFFRTAGGRASLRFEPSDTLRFNLMYQRLYQKGYYYQHVSGTGSPGRAAVAALGLSAIPANFNGPALSYRDYASVQETPSTVDNHTTLIVANANWEVLGHRLTYNFGSMEAPSTGATAVDNANVVPGFDFLPDGYAPGGKYRFHEVRVSSVRSSDRIFDYDVGFYANSSGTDSDGLLFNTNVFLPGSFGPNFYSVPGQIRTPLSRYVLPVQSVFYLKTRNYSFYANLQFHLGEKTELSAGIRYIHDRRPTRLEVTRPNTFANAAPFPFILASVPPAAQPFVTTCEAAGLISSPVYPGTCDAAVAGASTVDNPGGKTFEPVIYNASLSHRFSPDLLVYATVGSSWRQGLPAIGNTGLSGAFLVPKPEKATSYEVGIKSSPTTWIYFNADVFQIDYKDQLSQFEGIAYFNAVSGSASQTSLAFFANVDARVRGFEAEINARPLAGLTLAANLSYAKIKSKGGPVPCNDASRPISATNQLNFCPSVRGQVLNPTSPFQASFRGDYEFPVMTSIQGYARFIANLQGKNPAFGVSDSAFSAKSYATIDLYGGVRGEAGNWELGVYAKNAFNRREQLSQRGILNTVYSGYDFPGMPTVGTGYNLTSANQPREVGVTLRYAFGSR